MMNDEHTRGDKMKHETPKHMMFIGYVKYVNKHGKTGYVKLWYNTRTQRYIKSNKM